MNRLLPIKLATALAVASLCACQSLPTAFGQLSAPAPVALAPSATPSNVEIPASSLPLVEKRESLTATGYAVISVQNHRVPAQQRLLAIRAAKLDAYRSLTEQVYGLRMDATATVADMVVQNDTFRSRVEGVIYGASLVSITPAGDDTYETTLSLDKSTVQDLRMLYLSQLVAKNK
jgi:outer membrane protein FlgP